MFGRCVTVFEGKRAQVAIDPVTEVEISGAAGEPYAPKHLMSPILEPIVQGGSTERGGRRQQGEATIQRSAADGRLPAPIFTEKRFPDVLTGCQQGNELATEEMGIGRDGAQDEQVHDTLQALLPGLGVPSYPLIARVESENGVAESENTDQLLVGFIVDDESQAPAISCGYRHTPMHACVPEQQLILGLWLYQDEPRPDSFRNHVLPGGQIREEPTFVSLQARTTARHIVFDCFLMQRSELALVLDIRGNEEPRPNPESLCA